MNRKGYTVLGWIVWQIGRRVAKRKMAQNKVKLGAAATVLAVLVAGLAAAIDAARAAHRDAELNRLAEHASGGDRSRGPDRAGRSERRILAVIQSIVTRTLRHGSDMDVSRELLIGRIHAMSNVVTLLSESQWQGVKLKGLPKKCARFCQRTFFCRTSRR